MPYRKAADVKITNEVEFSEDELKEIICAQLEQHGEYCDVNLEPTEMELTVRFVQVDPSMPTRAIVTISWDTEKDIVR